MSGALLCLRACSVPPGGGLRAQAAQVALELLPSPPKLLCVLRALPSCSASTLDFSFALDTSKSLPLLRLRFAAQVAADARYLQHGPRRVWKSTAAYISRWRASRRGKPTFLRVRPARVSSSAAHGRDKRTPAVDVPFSHAPPRCLSSSIAPITSPHYSCHRLYR